MGFWDRVKKNFFDSTTTFGAPVDHHALIEIDLDKRKKKKKAREPADEQPGRTGELDDSVQAR